MDIQVYGYEVGTPALYSEQLIIMLSRFLLFLLNLTTAWVIDQGGVAIVGSGEERLPFKSIREPVDLYESQSLDVAFTIPPDLHPLYVALRLLSPKTQEEYLLLAKTHKNSAKAVFHYSSIPTTMLDQVLRVHVIASGNEVDPIEHSLFELVAYSNSDTKKAEDKTAMYGFSHLPEIIYTYNSAPRHASMLVASFFVAIIDSAFALLLLTWTSLARTLKSVVPTKRSQITTLIVIFGVEIVFLLYFLYMSIFSVVTALSILLPLLFVAAARI